jgi:hypothetical protein
MADSYGPRTYLIGQIVSALIQRSIVPIKWEQVADDAILLADLILDRMQYPKKTT